MLATQLQPQDTFSVVTFARTPRLWVDGVPGNQAGAGGRGSRRPHARKAARISKTRMNLAYQTALRHYLANGINRVVLLTDGAANLGNVEPDALKQKVEAQPQAGHRARLLRHRLGRLQRRSARSPFAQWRWPLRLHQHAGGSGDGIRRRSSPARCTSRRRT